MTLRASFFFALALAAISNPLPSKGYTQNNNSSVSLRWPAGAVIRYAFNEDFAPNNEKELTWEADCRMEEKSLYCKQLPARQ